MKQFKQLHRLVEIMARLRDQETGCPWDLEQNLKTLVPYTLEEAYELAEAIENEDEPEIVKELGDLLFHLVFYAQIGKEKQSFDLEKIAQTVSDKMIFRHPHVFSNHKYKNRQEFEEDWIKRKEKEKQDPLKEAKHLTQSLMANVSKSLPAMTRSIKLQKQAAYVGFDWDNSKDVLAKIKEEIAELEAVLESNCCDKDKIKNELGDVFFSCINLSRHLKLDPETVLRQANHKFSQRFTKMEQQIQFDHKKMQEMSIKELEQLWLNSKGLDSKKAKY